MKVCVVLPALNEEKGIVKVIRSVPDGHVNQLVVADGFSSDNTVINAKNASLGKKFKTQVVFREGEGKAWGLRSFIKWFDIDSYDVFVMLDSDFTYDPREVGKMVRPIETGEADVVMGDRFANPIAKDAMPISSYVGNRMLSWAAAALFFKNPKDLNTGYWAFSKKFLKSIRIGAQSFDLEANLFAQAVKKGFRIKTVPIRYRKRIGEKKLRISHGVTILARLLMERVS